MQLLSWLSVVLAIISLAIQLYDHRRPQPTLPSGAERHWRFVVRLELSPSTASKWWSVSSVLTMSLKL